MTVHKTKFVINSKLIIRIVFESFFILYYEKSLTNREIEEIFSKNFTSFLLHFYEIFKCLLKIDLTVLTDLKSSNVSIHYNSKEPLY